MRRTPRATRPAATTSTARDLGGAERRVLAAQQCRCGRACASTPRRSNSYEIGAKFNTRGFTLNVAAFREEFTELPAQHLQRLGLRRAEHRGVQERPERPDSDNGSTVAGPTGACTGNAEEAGRDLAGRRARSDDVADPRLHVHRRLHLCRHPFPQEPGRQLDTGEPLDPALFLLPGSQLSNAPKNVVTTSVAWTPDIGSNGLSGLVYVDSRLTSDYNTGSDLFPEKKQDGFAAGQCPRRPARQGSGLGARVLGAERVQQELHPGRVQHAVPGCRVVGQRRRPSAAPATRCTRHSSPSRAPTA